MSISRVIWRRASRSNNQLDAATTTLDSGGQRVSVLWFAIGLSFFQKGQIKTVLYWMIIAVVFAAVVFGLTVLNGFGIGIVCTAGMLILELVVLGRVFMRGRAA